MPPKAKPVPPDSMPAQSAPTVSLLADVRDILRRARGQAYASANFIMVEAYWRIGQRIVEEEQGGKDRAEYGTYLIRDLAKGLGDEFGRGVSVANLWNFKQFYLTFPSEQKLYALRRELTWSHWRLVMRVEDHAAREYYIHESAAQGWSTRQLERAIASGSYHRLLSPPTPSDSHPAPATNPESLIKDPYVLEFLGMPEPPPPRARTRGWACPSAARFSDGTRPGVFLRRVATTRQHGNISFLRRPGLL